MRMKFEYVSLHTIYFHMPRGCLGKNRVFSMMSGGESAHLIMSHLTHFWCFELRLRVYCYFAYRIHSQACFLEVCIYHIHKYMKGHQIHFSTRRHMARSLHPTSPTLHHYLTHQTKSNWIEIWVYGRICLEIAWDNFDIFRWCPGPNMRTWLWVHFFRMCMFRLILLVFHMSTLFTLSWVLSFEVYAPMS